MANLQEIIEESFTTYAGMALQSRALVDVRDCIKPSARQIFYSMLNRKLTHDKPYKKTANAVGMAMADYYIHGDSSCLGIIMRAGQNFAMRYPLVEVKGNAGNLMTLFGNGTGLRESAQPYLPFIQPLSFVRSTIIYSVITRLLFTSTSRNTLLSFLRK